MKYVLLYLCLVLLTGCTTSDGTPAHQDHVVVPKDEHSIPPVQELDETGTACFGTACYSVEIADDPLERKQGLMHRTGMGDDAGMLFIFETAASRRTFWMKNTLIPLDMIWLDDTWTIVHLEQGVPPCKADPCPSFGPKTRASTYVIELNAGHIQKHAIQVGDVVDFSR